MKTYNQLKEISDSFFKKCSDIASTKPWAVCVAMHEYALNTYPDDPHITIVSDICPTERLFLVTSELILFLEQVEKLSCYPVSCNPIVKAEEVKEETGEVYGKLWSKFSDTELIDNTAENLAERLALNDFDLKYFKGKTAIDIGCGSGRFTIALRKLGCESVVGVDYGEDGLKVADKAIEEFQIQGVSFRKTDVLHLPFEDEIFDFVFCNGVLHHTEDMELGIKEMIRVAKKGAKMWLYLYGDGGIFWYARKEMPKVMQKIQQTYTISMLDMIGMPSNKFIFCDNWYVPIERHTTDAEAREIINRYGVSDIRRLEKGRTTDLECLSINGGEVGKAMWGDGELRYIIEK